MSEQRPPGRYVIPERYERDGTSSRFTWYVYVEDVDEQGNVMRTVAAPYGVEFSVLRDTYGLSHQRFLNEFVKPHLLLHHEAVLAAHADAEELKGKPL